MRNAKCNRVDTMERTRGQANCLVDMCVRIHDTECQFMEHSQNARINATESQFIKNELMPKAIHQCIDCDSTSLECGERVAYDL